MTIRPTVVRYADSSGSPDIFHIGDSDEPHPPAGGVELLVTHKGAIRAGRVGEVIARQADLVEVVAHLKQVLCVKG